jgi:hypothetical protein
MRKGISGWLAIVLIWERAIEAVVAPAVFVVHQPCPSPCHIFDPTDVFAPISRMLLEICEMQM